MFPTLLTPLARWVACRHHTMELLVKAAYHELFGDSKSPDVKLFTLLKDPATWNSLELNNFRPPLIPRAFKDDVKPLLFFINKQLDEENQDKLPRGDYKEFLELAKIFLGGDVDRKKGYIFQLSRPGADHHARWMSKCIYFLKLFLLSDQFPQSQLSWQKKKKVKTMAIFIIFPYLQSWFTSPSLLGAAQNDLDLFKRLQKFSKIDKKISSATSSILSRHPWYLTEELISLFNISLPVEERTLLAKKIGSLPPANLKVCKPHLPQATVDSCLLDFVGPRSVLLFNLLGTSHTFLLEDDWMEQPDYFTTAAALENLSPLNDSCERALALAIIVNGKMTRTESSFQELVLVVEKHRKMYKIKTKEDMKKLF